MYNYRIPRSRWWEFASYCRGHYQLHHPVAQVLRKLTFAGDKLSSAFAEATKAVDELVGQGWTADLQLFDEGGSLLIRPLERGYFFMNNFEEHWKPFGMTEIFYDNRSDVPPSEELNKAIAAWVDQKILDGEYLTYSLISGDDLKNMCLDNFLAQVRKES